jgi:hypothetical protein
MPRIGFLLALNRAVRWKCGGIITDGPDDSSFQELEQELRENILPSNLT